MQRPCSAALLASAGSRSGILPCVEIAEGFKSPILHLRPSATDRRWLFSFRQRAMARLHQKLMKVRVGR